MKGATLGEHALSDATRASIRTIVVGVDGSAGAAHALRWAVREGQMRNVTVTAALAAEDTSGLTAPIERESVRGGATSAVLAAASDAQLLVLATTARGLRP